MNVEFPEIAEVKKALTETVDRLEHLEKLSVETLTAEWYNDEACWKLKGGGSLKSFRVRRYWQPKGGIADALIQGRKCWNRETVREWLKVTDEQLPAYHEKYKTGAKKEN